MAIDAVLFKQVMRQYATGIMVLTVPAPMEESGGMYAMTVNSVTSVSLEPTLLLVCIEKTARSHALVHRAGVFALNILSADQVELGKQFAYNRAARERPQQYVRGTRGQTGALLFDESLGYLECRVAAAYPGGDHTIFVGEVIMAAVKESQAGPLIYFGGQWLGLPKVG